MSKKTAAALLQVAAAEVGYLEKASNSQLDSATANAGDANWTKYARDFDQKYPNFYNGKKNGFAWCDMFVDWCFVTAFGVTEALALLCQPTGSCGAGCIYSAGYYKKYGQLYTSDPKPGDQIFFGNSLATSSHTGIVEKVEGGKVYTIEGNAGNKVQRLSYSLSSSKIVGYGRPNYDAEDGAAAETPVTPTPTAAITYTAGATNEETIYNFLRQVIGLNVAGACGIIANIYRESGFRPTALGDSGTSYGICQWHASRFSNLKAWCSENGKDYTTLDGQLWYLKAELEKSYAAVLSYIKAVANTATGAYNAGYRWCLKFEIPANTVASSEQRGELARGTYWPKYAAGAGGTVTTPTVSQYTGKFKVGDVVQYNGTTHHVSAASQTPKTCRGGRATVTNVYPSGDHPYHLVRVPGSGATVYGWVDEGEIAAIATAEAPATPVTPAAQAEASSYTPAVGDIVQFNGTEHYVNAESTVPKTCKSGPAKVTQIYRPESARHPYHLVKIAGKGSTVYGWVDAGTFVKA